MVFSCPPSFRQKVIRAFLAHSSGVNKCPFIFYYCSPPFALSLCLAPFRPVVPWLFHFNIEILQSVVMMCMLVILHSGHEITRQVCSLERFERLVLSSRMAPSMRDYVQMWGCCMPHVNSGHIMRMMLWTTLNSSSIQAFRWKETFPTKRSL